MASSSSSEPNNQEGKPSNNIPVDENVMQKHVGFFDRNHDGVVYPWETFQGLRAIGCGRLLSTASIIIMHLSFSQITRPGKKPSPFFPIEVKNIQLAKHGSDSGVYDNEGRFIPSKFEEIFSKHAHAFPNALTYDEIQQMLKAKRDPKDYKGWVFSEGAWTLLFILGKDKNGLLQKETVRGVYDGSLFEQLEKKHSENKKK